MTSLEMALLSESQMHNGKFRDVQYVLFLQSSKESKNEWKANFRFAML